jgi:carbohydrate-selective porin OprB
MVSHPMPDPAVPDASQDLVSISRSAVHHMSTHGVAFQGLLVYDWSRMFPGNYDPDAGHGRYSFDVMMPVDARKLFGLRGSRGMIRLKHHIDQFGDSDESDAQVASNIDAPSRTTLYEIWLEQKLFSDKVRLKAGKIDANTEFAAVQNSGDFLNSSMGYSPTILAFPTYPEPRAGINVFLQPVKNYLLGLGVFRTAGNGTLWIMEPGHTWSVGPTEHPGRASVGYWRTKGSIDPFDEDEPPGQQGVYAVVEQSAWLQPLGSRGMRELLTYLQAGWVRGRVNSFTRHLGAGVVLQGPFRSRSRDGIGLAATWVRVASDPDGDYDFRAELTWEAYYKVTFSRHIALVQDFQNIHQSGAGFGNRDRQVITPRMVITF